MNLRARWYCFRHGHDTKVVMGPWDQGTWDRYCQRCGVYWPELT